MMLPDGEVIIRCADNADGWIVYTGSQRFVYTDIKKLTDHLPGFLALTRADREEEED